MTDITTSRATAQRFRAALRLLLAGDEPVEEDGSYWLLRGSVPVAVRYSRAYRKGARTSWWYGITSADAEKLGSQGELALIMPSQALHRFLVLNAERTKHLLSRCGQDGDGVKKIHINADASGNDARLQEWPELELKSIVRLFSGEALKGAGLDANSDEGSDDGEAATDASVPTIRRALHRPRAFDPVRVPTSARELTFRRDPAATLVLREKANAEHHRLVSALHDLLAGRSWTEIEEIPCAIDLWAVRSHDRRRVIFECKTLRSEGAGELHQCRLGLAQLLEYRFRYGTPDDELCLVTNGAVNGERVEFLESMEVGVLWLERGQVRPLGRRTIATLAWRAGEVPGVQPQH